MSAPLLSPHRFLQFAARGLWVALVFVASPALAQEPAAASLLSVLSYNVHGLSPFIAKDSPRARLTEIGARASRYDVALFQEDFEYHGVIRRQMQGSVGVRGNGMAFDLRRLAAKILLAPVAVLADFSAPYGAGLSSFVKAALVLPGDVDRKAFGVCDGWVGAALDCWASKGYLRVGVRTSEGVIVDVYNTHLDAGEGKRSVKTRRRQLRRLASAIETQSGERAIIVGGDFNLAFDRPGDGEVMLEFRERLHLQDSGAGAELPFWRNRDYILYRSGAQAQLRVEQAGEALEFVDGGHALSNHPAISAHFRVRALPRNEGEEDGDFQPAEREPA